MFPYPNTHTYKYTQEFVTVDSITSWKRAW